MTNAYEVRPTVYGRVIGLGLGKFRFVGSGVALVLAALLPSMVASVALAGPQGGKVVAGNATIRQQGNRTVIRASNGSIINYSSFNLNPNESVRFVQPNATSRVLNRITSDAPTTLNGTITANGIVYFANRAGVIFGPNSVINVGGIYAAAGNISNRDFIGGNDHFTNVTGSVSNAGQIDAKFAALVGERIENTGTIEAAGGMIAMVAGNEVTLSPRGGTMSVKIVTNSPVADPSGKAAIENTGTLRADGGSALMVAGDIYSLAVKNTGNVRARNIKIEGRGNAGVQVSGKLDASNQIDGSRGGSIEVTGKTVDLVGANLNASGRRGGGEILVGGDLRGEGTLRNALNTHVDADSTLNADATGAGNGGKVVVWSDRTTTVYGDISASGGTRSGDGGVIETSGKINLDIRGASIQARARSASGKGGMWLMDPVNVSIEANPDDGTTQSGSGTITFDPDNSVSPAIVDVATINAALTGGTNVTIITGSVGTDAGNITVNTPISVAISSDVTLSLRAANDVDVAQSITATGAGKLNLELFGNFNGGGVVDTNVNSGSVIVSAPISTNGGALNTLGIDYTQNAGGTIATGGGSVTIQNVGAISISDTLDAGIGSASSVFLQGSSVTLNSLVSSGSGGLTLRPSNGAFNINLNNGSGAFDVTAASLGNIAIGGSGVLTIGVAGGTGAIGIGSSGDIDLSSFAHDITILGGAVTFNGALAFHSSHTLTFTTDGITDSHSGTDLTGGTLVLGIASGSASLGTSIAAVGGSVGTDLTIDNDTDLSVGSLTIGGNLDLAATGTLTSFGDQQVTGTTSLLTRANGGAAIDMGGSSSTFGGAITARSRNAADSADAAGPITLNADSDINLASVATTGAFDLTTTGNVLGSGVVKTGAATIAAGGTTVGTVTISQLQAAGTVKLTTTAGGDVDLTNSTDITIDSTSSIGGNLTLTATTGNIDVQTTAVAGSAIALTTSAANATIDTAALAGAKTFTLTSNGASGDVDVSSTGTATIDSASSIGGDLTVASTTGNIDVQTTDVGGSNITLTTAAANATVQTAALMGAKTFIVSTTGATGDANLSADGGVTIDSTSSIGGSLTATAVTGNIDVQTTAVGGSTVTLTTQASNATIATAALTGAKTFVLSTTGSGGDADVAASAGVTIDSTSSIGGDLTAAATTGNIDVQTTDVGGSNITLTTAAANATIQTAALMGAKNFIVSTTGATGDANLSADGGVTIDSTSSIGGSLTATAVTGNIDVQTTAVGGSTVTLTTQASNATITTAALTGAKTFVLSTTGSGGDADVAASAGVTIDSTSSIGGDLTAAATTGNIDVQTTDVGGSNITLTTAASNATITTAALMGAKTFVLSTAGSAGNVNVAADGGVTIDSTSSIGGNLTATAVTGNIDVQTTDVGGLAVVLTTQASNATINTAALAGAKSFTLSTVGSSGDANVAATGLMSILSNVAGTLTFTGGSGVTIASIPTLNLGASSATGFVTITAPDINITGLVAAGAAGIILQPDTDTDTIGINSAGSDFSLTTAELLNLQTTGTVIIGRLAGTGLTSIGGLGAVDLSTTTYSLTLRGGQANFADTLTLADDKLLTLHTAGVASTASGNDVVIGGTNGRILLDTSAAVDIGTQVALVAGTTSAGDITIDNAGVLEVGSIGMVNGLTGASGQAVSVTSTGDLTLSNSVDVAGPGDIALVSSAGNVIFGAGAAATTGPHGSVSVTADQGILAPSDITAQITTGAATLTATNGDIGGANPLRIDASTLTAVVGGNADIINLGTADLDAQIAGGASSLVSLASAGSITIATGHTITGDRVTLQATDLDLSGTIVAGNTINLRRETDGTIGVGDAIGDMSISKAELSHLTAATLNIGGVHTVGITADNVAEADVATIGAVNLLALADGGDVTFSGMASTFHNLGVRADDSINVSVDLVSSLGGLSLTADDDAATDTDGDKINIASGVTISTSAPSGGDITMAASGGIMGAGSLTLDSNGGITIQNAITSMGTLTLLANGGITLNGAGSATAVAITADDGVTIADDLTSTTALTINSDADADGMGLFTLASGKTISTGGNNLNITCGDIQLDGLINVGGATVAIAPAVSKTIGLGVATGDIQISGAELSHITAGTLSLGSELTTAINVDTVAAGDTANISGLMILLADDINITGAFNTANASLAIARARAGNISVGLAPVPIPMDPNPPMVIDSSELALITTHNLQIGGGGTNNISVNGVLSSDTANMDGVVTLLANGTVSFISNASTFKALTVTANNGIHINRNITTTVGDMILDGDANSSAAADGDDAITIGSGRTLDAAGALRLRASHGNIVGNGSLTLNAGDGMTIFNDLGTSGITTIDADHNADNIGELIVSAGRTVNTSGNDLHISAADLTLDGFLTTNAATISITRSATGTIGLGLASGDMTITGGELGHMIATGLTIGGSTITGLTVNGVTSTNSNSIAGTVTLIAGAGAMTFNGTASAFHALDAQASGGLAVSAALSTDNGMLRLDGNSDHAGSDGITLTANITADVPPVGGAAPVNGFNIDLVSDVKLGSTVTITGRDVKFEGKLDSVNDTSRDLTVNSLNGGVTTFGGDVGSAHRLFTLTTNADGLTQIGGNISTTGTVEFFDAVRLTQDSIIDISAGAGVFFNSTVDTANSSPMARSLTVLVPRSTAAGAVNVALISFGGRVGATKALNNLTLNYDGTMAGDGRDNVPGVATIIARTRNAAGDIVAAPTTPLNMLFNLTGTFRMGHNEKLTAEGALTINAPTAAFLGDLTSLGNLAVNSPNITLLRRAGGRLLGNQGLNGRDDGLDFVSGGTINFTSVPVAVGSGIDPRFGTVDGGGVSPTLNGFLFQAFGPMDISLINSAGTTLRTLDLKSSGPTNTNIANTIAGAIPRESRQNDVGEDVTVGQAQFDQIKQLGIVPRNPTAGELVELLTGSATYDDFPRNNPPTAEDYTTVVNRLPSEGVSALLDAYDSVFNKPLLDESGNPVLDSNGKARRTSRTQEIQDALLASVRRYREASKAKPGAAGEIDPSAFRAFLEQNEQEAESLGYVRQLNTFLNKLDRVGLTARELAQSKAIILNPVRPRGIKNVQQFESVIRAESSRVLK